MNLKWTLRILRGPMRPFLLRKAIDRIRAIRDVRRARRMVPTPLSEGLTLRSNIVPLPSAGWFSSHGSGVMEFAERMRAGVVTAYGIERWNVGEADPVGVDIRAVHELSRMHHWCAYALAAHIDGAKRDEWCELLLHEIATFVHSYPVGTGVHWQFPMGTGIRLHSMLVAWDWARRSGWRSAEGDRLVAAAAVDHALMTYAERESRGGLSTSHYAANLLGVLAASVYVEGHPDMDQWKRLSSKELLREVMRQILPDGMTGEASTGYHRQIVDTFVHALHLMYAASTPIVPDDAHGTHLLLAVARCRQLDRLGMPLIGDNDDGLSMKLAGFDPDMSYAYDVIERLYGAAATLPVTTDMDAFGLAVLEGGSVQCTLRNGPVGQFGKGGHAHNDQNSITVRVEDRWFVIDPGTSVYTLDVNRRNIERSAGRHSLLWPPSADQADHPPGESGLFWLLDDQLQHRLERIAESSLQGVVSRTGIGRHERNLQVVDGSLTGWDRFLAESGHVAECVFVFHPDVRVEAVEANYVDLSSEGIGVRLEWSAGKGRIETCSVSHRFGQVRHTNCLRIAGHELGWSIRRQ